MVYDSNAVRTMYFLIYIYPVYNLIISLVACVNFTGVMTFIFIEMLLIETFILCAKLAQTHHLAKSLTACCTKFHGFIAPGAGYSRVCLLLFLCCKIALQLYISNMDGRLKFAPLADFLLCLSRKRYIVYTTPIYIAVLTLVSIVTYHIWGLSYHICTSLIQTVVILSAIV